MFSLEQLIAMDTAALQLFEVEAALRDPENHDTPGAIPPLLLAHGRLQWEYDMVFDVAAIRGLIAMAKSSLTKIPIGTAS